MKKQHAIAIICAALALILAVVFTYPYWKPGKGAQENASAEKVSVEAVYPEPVASSMSAQSFAESDAHWDWWKTYVDKTNASAVYQDSMRAYNKALIQALLVSEDENTVCSPLNTFIAFSMLAEVTDGQSRAQVLNALGVSDIEALRTQVAALWDSNYVDTPSVKSLLADSFWLRDGVRYNKETLDRLARIYYASAYSGTPGSAEMDEALQKWTNDNTGGLLENYVKGLKLDPSTVMALVSTLYYKAAWVDSFLPNNTTSEVFHGTLGDTNVDMMRRTEDMMGVFSSDTFSAISLNLNDSGTMVFCLPNEGTDVNAVLADPNLLNLASFEDPHWSYPMVHLSIPKFKVDAKMDLLDTMRQLGMTDVLDPEASDFTPLTEDFDNLYVSQAEHAAMVEIDEDGVTGAAYTELAIAEGAALPEDEIDFVLDRPFVFLVLGRDGSVLFSGVVRNIG